MKAPAIIQVLGDLIIKKTIIRGQVTKKITIIGHRNSQMELDHVGTQDPDRVQTQGAPHSL